MNISNIIQEIFHRQKLDDISIEQLQTLTNEEPYFAASHFLLLKKLQQNADAGFERQVQKTALYFENPLWLHFLLNDNNEVAANENSLFKSQSALPVSANENSLTLNEATGVKDAENVDDTKEEQVTHIDTINDDSEVINVSQNKTAAMEPQLPILTQPGEKDALIFEPYHTIDYFASLGIKLGKETPANDKLGNQLKSFTQWLKTLKRLPEIPSSSELQEPEEQPEPDEKVEAMAAVSIKEKETLTESMAEVLLKQGKKEIAVQMYNKLSLLNPDKSHYFAAKIEALKQN